ncbi:MAG: NADH-quinone oxidoreductase subunit N [Chloroflexi bacterium]|nr:NADH-quinone oxidoreductase subunit N [Chloroflexota bacterium]MDP6498258.1 NADH-quinone oxidoreductase subunit N [Dehalococcoidia bacterium]MQG55128.1 NADH-quinone oxidoreductase subunit N [SAR202 cluster bacterium]
MTSLSENIDLLTPEFALAGLAFLVFAIDLFLPEGKKSYLALLSIVGLIAIIVLSLVMLWDEQESLYDGLLAVDNFALFFKVFFLGMGIFIILSSIDFVESKLKHQGEFYGLLLFSILGMNVMAQSRELLTAYIALELLSFSLYVLVAYAKDSAKSNESALKYIIVGAVSSAILLYGVSMVYSTLGVTKFEDIAVGLASASEVSPALWVGVGLILVGLMFKVSAAPFHMWAPDVYEGAPYPVTAYLAIGSKAAAFALILRLVSEGFVPAAERWEQWQLVFAVLAAATMLVGNLVALAQKNLKRLMAYSSIGHAGFILAGITALSFDSDLASNGVMFYLVGYSITNLVVFAAIISFFNMTDKEMITDLGGLADRQPFLAACLGMGLFSLAGLPIFAGFTMKFYLFTAVAAEGFLWLAALAVFASLISLYYYLQVLRQVYIEPAPLEESGAAMLDEHPALTKIPSLSLLTVLGTGAGAMIWLGVYPRPLIGVIEAASRALLS